MFWMNTSLGSTPSSSFVSSGRDSFCARYSSMNSHLDLRRLQAHPVRDDETRAAADPVRLDAWEIAMPADLRVLGAFSVDRDGTVRHDE